MWFGGRGAADERDTRRRGIEERQARATTEQEAAEGVRAFHPAVVYPYHYMGSDTNQFAKALEGTGIDVRLRNWY